MLLKFYSRVNVREREMMGRVGEISDVCRCLFQFISKLHCLLACSRSYSRYVREILIKFSTKFSLVCVCLCVMWKRIFLHAAACNLFSYSFEDDWRHGDEKAQPNWWWIYWFSRWTMLLHFQSFPTLTWDDR